MSTLEIYDTTLRDGSQGEGVNFSLQDKLALTRRLDELVEKLSLSDVAVCTSGDYERRGPLDTAAHHIIAPRTGRSSVAVASVTVVARTAMLADAVATAAFVLGPQRGLRFIEAQGAEGLMLTPGLERHATAGFSRYQG